MTRLEMIAAARAVAPKSLTMVAIFDLLEQNGIKSPTPQDAREFLAYKPVDAEQVEAAQNLVSSIHNQIAKAL